MSELHPRNPHKGKYDMDSLCRTMPELTECIISNPSGEKTIDFADSASVLLLNKALLKHYYNVENWTIPPGYLCPPVPGRADYIHYAADLLADDAGGEVPKGKKVQVLDIGTGANCIYPIIGSQAYGWKFTASEIDPLSLKTARLIVQTNPSLSKVVKVKQQKQKQFILRNVIEANDRFALTLCNPPFHGSKKEAMDANKEKWRKLTGKEQGNQNFGGMENELWFPGGEKAFISRMIRESVDFASQVNWFTSLVSRGENLSVLEKELDNSGCTDRRIIAMSQGQKQSRLIAWTFLDEKKRKI